MVFSEHAHEKRWWVAWSDILRVNVTGVLVTEIGIKNITENRGVLQKSLATKKQQNLRLALFEVESKHYRYRQCYRD